MNITIGDLVYEIEIDGKIHKRRGSGYLKAFPDKDGYLKVAFTLTGNKTVNAFVHRLVYQAFHGEIPEGMTVDHIDDDRLNNHAGNLQLLTSKDNAVKGNARHYTVRDPEGGEHSVYNLRQFCRDHDLHRGHLYTGKYKGWSLI